MAPCPGSATTPGPPKFLTYGPNRHERHTIHGHRRTEAGRCCAVDRTLVPGAAGLSDVGTGTRWPPHARRLSAAGAAAAPDVGRWRACILRGAARRRRSDTKLAHI